MNIDFIECERYYQEVYIECVGECNTDYSCSSQCAREFEAQTKNCPCKENCPNGCPCTDYSCPDSTTTLSTTTKQTTTEELRTTTKTTTTSTAIPTAKSSILILSTYSYRDPNGPVITDSTGKVAYAGDVFNFEYGDQTDVYYGCSITYRGDFYVLGSKNEKTQIAKVNGCRLERIGSLSFEFYSGGCSVANEEIFICFSYNDKKQCYVGNDPLGSFSKISKSNFDHDGTHIASNNGE